MCPSTLEIGAGRRSSAPLQKSRFETDAWGNSEMANPYRSETDYAWYTCTWLGSRVL